jgi:hypothetical protein
VHSFGGRWVDLKWTPELLSRRIPHPKISASS